NTDEEKLPPFVYDLRPVYMGKDGDFAPTLIKRRMHCEPAVTMRLETPVLYVHLPPGQQTATFDLSVEFRGGILSQFYPRAEATVDRNPLRQIGNEVRVGETLMGAKGRDRGLRFTRTWSAPDLTAATTSTLTWRGLVAGTTFGGPATNSPVWLAPRQVDSANLMVGAERERYLFYRGLGHLDAPLVARRSATGNTLMISPRHGIMSPGLVPALWFADLRGNGTAAFRAVPASSKPLRPGADLAISTIPATFTEADYSAERLALLRRELQTGLMQEGLFADEALALLATWEASYFKAPGQRLFFLVPNEWTEHILPLTISVPATVKRAMMGRIELVSPAQRQAIAVIAAGPVSDQLWFRQFIEDHLYSIVGDQVVWRPGGAELSQRVFVSNDRGVLDGLNIAVPKDYQAYLSLGRFRDALLWDAQRQQPDPEVRQFLRTYQLTWLPYGWQAEALDGKPVASLSTP
ncbi:MAG TPA: hypothetical protein VHX44_03150, partial [Planctomycetota bacterium]|nr:hypothetical protein [Planctomycetota bacterium]